MNFTRERSSYQSIYAGNFYCWQRKELAAPGFWIAHMEPMSINYTSHLETITKNSDDGLKESKVCCGDRRANTLVDLLLVVD